MFISNKLKTVLFTISISVLSTIPAHAATFKVAPGDTLYKIGNLFGTGYSTIMKDNKLSNSVIYPGENLYVKAQTYTVKSGDTLYGIAIKFGVQLDSLRVANGKWDNMIYPGQTINIPSASAAPVKIKRTSSTVAIKASAPAKTTTPVATQTAAPVKRTTQTAAQAPSSSAVIPYTQSDLDLLARLINAEASGEPYNAKVSVGAVIVNRVKDSRFPNTINGVINEVDGPYYQFTPVENGMINNPAPADAVQAANAALHGVDPTHGAFYYYDTSTTNKWLLSKPKAIQIDKMVFTYF